MRGNRHQRHRHQVVSEDVIVGMIDFNGVVFAPMSIDVYCIDVSPSAAVRQLFMLSKRSAFVFWKVKTAS